MTLATHQRALLAHLDRGPLTAGEVQRLEPTWPKTMVESALLLAEHQITVTSVRHRGYKGGSGREARVYQKVSA
jgi:hypothetical protein